MSLHEPDYELDGFEPADDGHEQHRRDVGISSLKVLGEHRTDTDSYFVLLDEGATWGIPGSPQLRAVHVSRDLSARTFEVDSKELPLYAMAQSYLIARGCPSDALSPPEGVHDPADDRTRALEARVRGDGDHFALLASYTADMRDPVETVVMLRSLDPQAVPEFRTCWRGSTGTPTPTPCGKAGSRRTPPRSVGGRRGRTRRPRRCRRWLRPHAAARCALPRRHPCRRPLDGHTAAEHDLRSAAFQRIGGAQYSGEVPVSETGDSPDPLQHHRPAEGGHFLLFCLVWSHPLCATRPRPSTPPSWAAPHPAPPPPRYSVPSRPVRLGGPSRCSPSPSTPVPTATPRPWVVLRRGEPFTASVTDGAWLHVTTASGITGWVDDGALRFDHGLRSN